MNVCLIACARAGFGSISFGSRLGAIDRIKKRISVAFLLKNHINHFVTILLGSFRKFYELIFIAFYDNLFL